MAKSTKPATTTAEDVVAQNGGLEVTASPAVENNATEVEVVEEEVVPATPVVEEVATEVVQETAPVVENNATTETASQEVEVEEVAERTMDCLGLKNHTCRIGGNVITVTKDKVQSFTVGVATVLQRASIVIVK